MLILGWTGSIVLSYEREKRNGRNWETFGLYTNKYKIHHHQQKLFCHKEKKKERRKKKNYSKW